MGYIAGICIVAVVTWGIYKLFELFARRKERLAIIDKLSERMNPEDVKEALDYSLLPKMKSTSFGALKASLLMIGIGIGLIVSFFLQYHYLDVSSLSRDNWEVWNNANELKFILNFSGVAIFGGLGLLVAYLIEARKR